jgi:carbon monoxide dehydrogenase subunit G
MASASVTVTIDRPVEDVFAVLTKVENAARWSRATEESLLTPGPMRVGTQRRAVVPSYAGRTTANVMELTELVPDRRLAMRGVSGFPFDVRFSFDLAPEGGTTRLDWLGTFEPRGLLRPLGPLFAAIVRWAIRQDIRNLRAMMEAGTL